LLAVAVALYVVAALLLWLHKKWKATAIKVAGTVTSVREGWRQTTDSDNNTTTEKVYYPTVKYEGEGRSFEHAFGETSATTKPYTVGQEVEIYFQPGSPDKPLLGAISMKLAFGWVFLIVATVILALALFVKK
jgi:hypothetical protein